MEIMINNEIIRKFKPCYDPSEVEIPENETLSIKEWVEKYRNVVKNKEDVIWLLCRSQFMSDKDQRLYAVWCARESFKLQEYVDQRSIDACNVAEKFANGEATQTELESAESAARSARSAARSARSAAESAARSARSAAESARSAAESAESAWSAAWSAQIDQLLTYF